MYHRLLLCLLIVPISAIHSMELTKMIEQNKKVYTLFIQTHYTEAKKIIPRDQYALTSLFRYGIDQNNTKFIQWLLNTKKPLFDERCVQESFTISSQYNHVEITNTLNTYINAGKDERYRELQIYIIQEISKMDLSEEELDEPSNSQSYINNIPGCRCIIS